MHSEVCPLLRPPVFPLVALHCHSLCLASTPSRGFAPSGFVGIIPLSKNGAADPDVGGSNLYLEETERSSSGQGCHHPTTLKGWFPTHSAPTATPRG